MPKHLQQLDTATKDTDREAGVYVSSVQLKANSALLLGLVLIIPTISGVALIA